MFQIPLEDIVKRIKEERGLEEEKIMEMIERKVSELKGLVTREGAAHIVANELGVQLLEDMGRKELQLKNLIPGLRNVTVVGRVLRVFEGREWQKGDRKGKVASFIIADGTGRTRVTIWDKRVDMVGKDIKEGDIVRIHFGFVKKGNYGPEIHLREKSKIEVNPEGVKLPSLEELTKKAERFMIKDLQEGLRAEIRATVVDMAMRNPFFEVCPKCGKRVTQEGGEFVCERHGRVEPAYSIAISVIFDDGTGNIRAVLFGREAERFLGVKIPELFEDINKDMEGTLKKLAKRVLGKEFVVVGDVKRNDFTGFLELLVRSVREPNPVEEAKDLIEELRI